MLLVARTRPHLPPITFARHYLVLLGKRTNFRFSLLVLLAPDSRRSCRSRPPSTEVDFRSNIFSSASNFVRSVELDSRVCRRSLLLCISPTSSSSFFRTLDRADSILTWFLSFGLPPESADEGRLPEAEAAESSSATWVKDDTVLLLFSSLTTDILRLALLPWPLLPPVDDGSISAMLFPALQPAMVTRGVVFRFENPSSSSLS
mmetsp:Transcript_43793/g.105643  ORF Transcript_43793/g.105643 Transcript_43793/m.105643 type:complete len:204 (-) Transcript_43793:2001-2612(-)